MRRILFVLFTLFLTGCASHYQVQQGKSSFQDKDYTAAFASLNPAASSGNADAQYAVGYMHYYGLGTVKNKRRAMMWIRKAASQGQPDAVKAMDLINDEHLSTTFPLAMHHPKTND